MLVGIKSDHHMITDQVPVIFSSPVQGTLYVFLIQIIWLPSIIHVSVYYIILYILYYSLYYVLCQYSLCPCGD